MSYAKNTRVLPLLSDQLEHFLVARVGCQVRAGLALAGASAGVRVTN